MLTKCGDASLSTLHRPSSKKFRINHNVKCETYTRTGASYIIELKLTRKKKNNNVKFATE